MTFTEQLLNFLDYFGDEQEFELKAYYSGRAMYGKTCVGIIVTDSELGFWLGAIGAAWVQSEYGKEFDPHGDFLVNLSEYSTDSMGYDTIIYWKRATTENNILDYN